MTDCRHSIKYAPADQWHQVADPERWMVNPHTSITWPAGWSEALDVREGAGRRYRGVERRLMLSTSHPWIEPERQSGYCKPLPADTCQCCYQAEARSICVPVRVMSTGSCHHFTAKHRALRGGHVAAPMRHVSCCAGECQEGTGTVPMPWFLWQSWLCGGQDTSTLTA